MSNVLMFLLIPFAVVAPWDEKLNENRRVYDKHKKFSIIPPLGWDDKPKNDGANTILSRIGPFADSFSNFNVRRVDTKGDETSLKETVSTVKEELKKTQSDFEVLEEKELKIDGKDVYVLFSRLEKRQGTGSAKFKAASYFVRADNNTVYVVTFVLMPAVYERLKPKVEQSAATIRIAP